MRQRRTYGGRVRARSRPLWRFAFLLLLASAGVVWGQDQVRPSSVAGRLFRPVSFEQREYNVKAGPISFRLTSALRFEFTDNLNLSEENRESDLIVSPAISTAMYWPITPYNAISLNATLGYHFYLAHPELNNSSSGLTLSPDTDLSFDFYAGAFRINIHEQPSLQQDATGEATLSNIPLFGRFTNTAGATVVWTVNPYVALWSSYDHTDFITTSSEFSFADFAQDQLSFTSQIILSNAISGGLETATSSTRYRTSDKQDATSSHVGIFGEALATPYTRFRIAGGFQNIRFDGGPQKRIELVADSTRKGRDQASIRFVDTNDGPASDGTYYLNFIVTNQLSRYYVHSLTVAKESQLGITSQRVDLWSVRYRADWRLNRWITLDGTLLFDDGTESGGGNDEHFQRYGASLSTGFALSRKLTLSLGYDFIRKESDVNGQSYTRNLVFGQFDYSF